jgi:hypothetical protein
MDNMQDKIKKVAVYDGYMPMKHMPSGYGGGEPKPPIPITLKRANKYLTDLNILHPLAMRVVDELRLNKYYPFCKTEVAEEDILSACGNKPNEQGQYLDLFNAVHDGIELLEKLKL